MNDIDFEESRPELEQIIRESLVRKKENVQDDSEMYYDSENFE